MKKKIVVSISLPIISFLFVAFSIFCKNAPSAFGKTHFIVGTDSKDFFKHKKTIQLKNCLNISNETSNIAKAFFTPDDDAQSILLNLIACEEESISMAAFLITDIAVAKALLEAKKRGVKVEIIADKICCNGRHGKVAMLHNGGIKVFVYCGGNKNGSQMSDIMHNKFVIFKKNIMNRSLLWTGSFNFTVSARLKNQENILLLSDSSIINRYEKQFNLIKARCTHLHANLFDNKKASNKKNLKAHNRPDGIIVGIGSKR